MKLLKESYMSELDLEIKEKGGVEKFTNSKKRELKRLESKLSTIYNKPVEYNKIKKDIERIKAEIVIANPKPQPKHSEEWLKNKIYTLKRQLETDEDSRYDWRKYDEMALAHYKKLLKQDYNYDYDKGDYMTESKNPLKDAQKFAKKHRKGQGYFVKYNAGDVEKGIEMFNSATSIGATPVSSEAMGEDMRTEIDRVYNIRKELNYIDQEENTDLRNMYDALELSQEDKKSLVKLLASSSYGAVKDFIEKKYNKIFNINEEFRELVENTTKKYIVEIQPDTEQEIFDTYDRAYDLYRDTVKDFVIDRDNFEELHTVALSELNEDGTIGETLHYWDSEDSDDAFFCDWCGDEYESSELHDTSVGKLCDKCIRAIESRGEDITLYESFGFKEQANYLRKIADKLKALNNDKSPKIDMNSLINNIIDTANEAEQESKGTEIKTIRLSRRDALDIFPDIEQDTHWYTNLYSEIEFNLNDHYLTLKGNVEDLYKLAKDFGVAGWREFQSLYNESLDKQDTKILTEGMWQFPSEKNVAERLRHIMKRPITKSDILDKGILGGIIGDDNFYDAIEDDFYESDRDMRDIIQSYIKTWVEDYELYHKDPQNSKWKWYIEIEPEAIEILKDINNISLNENKDTNESNLLYGILLHSDMTDITFALIGRDKERLKANEDALWDIIDGGYHDIDENGEHIVVDSEQIINNLEKEGIKFVDTDSCDPISSECFFYSGDYISNEENLIPNTWYYDNTPIEVVSYESSRF